MIFGLAVSGRGVVISDVSPSYKNHRCSVEIVLHCVWLYFRFPLRLRAVEELMLARGVISPYEHLVV
ncbi:hypothetical protein GCM10009730_59140 [Streptomyces albidochromogenes]